VAGTSLSGAVPRDLAEPVEAVFASVKQGNDLRGFAKKLPIGVNIVDQERTARRRRESASSNSALI
jgi:hypothetical protein